MQAVARMVVIGQGIVKNNHCVHGVVWWVGYWEARVFVEISVVRFMFRECLFLYVWSVCFECVALWVLVQVESLQVWFICGKRMRVLRLFM